MQRLRRLASVTVVASLAVVGLSACRSDPQVAAYVGGHKITEDRVDQVLDDAKAKTAAGSQQASAITRQAVVNMLVGVDVLDAVATQRGVTPAAAAPDQLAQSSGMSADTQYVQIAAQYQALVTAVTGGGETADPTQADLRDVYDRLTAGGANPTKESFQQFAGSISDQDKQTLQHSIGVRDALRPAVAKLDTVVNPKYTAPSLTLVSTQDSQGNAIPLVVLSFASSDEAPTVVPAS